jgi:hypothetical protein
MKEQQIPKKRGRKPKGGKIVKNEINTTHNNIEKKNIILHLKCKINDIPKTNFQDITMYDPTLCNVEPFSNENNYETLPECSIPEDKKDNKVEKQKKTIYTKINELEKMLNLNNIRKKSCCFWCTCDFDSPSIHIPKLFYKETYEVYGCFCSPECAASYLFNENIENSFKFERYQMLNNIYGKIYDYNKNIKLAPNPYYTLDKYYGNLSIQEYRQLLTYERLLLIIDKPLTKIFPELHEDNNDFETLYENKLVLKKINKIEKNKIISNVFGN